jgi:tripartite-type tricarboxylate transporter receptor subunit TctC
MKRHAVAFLACLFLACLAAAHAQNYPVKPIRIVVPFAAGGVADITARVVSQKMGEHMGQQLLVDNRPSAGGVVAAEAVAKAPPDGYTLFLVSNGTAVSASLFKTLPYDTLKDFAPISTLGYFDIVLLVNPASRYETARDLIAAAKAAPNKLSIGSINVGSTQNLAAELFRTTAGIDAATIPYKATPEVITALRSGDIQGAFEILAPVLGQIRGGTVKAIGIASDRRFAGLPGVPTIAESGLPGYQASSWNGLSAPAKTPRPIVDRLHAEVSAAVAAPEVRNKLLELGVDSRASTPEELQKFLAAEIAKWGQVIDKAKIPKQ